jgi:hypothetical protein
LSSEKKYEDMCLHFKKGYLLSGCIKSGKSLAVEIVSTSHNMPIYFITLYSNMTDIKLIYLISIIPPKSIILIENIDKQFENSSVTLGGLLLAVDGPQRISLSSIFIMTSNNKDFEKVLYQNNFFEKGRIDKIVHFHNKIF